MQGITSVPSITYEVEKELPEKPVSPENSVGINLVLENFSTLSGGIAIDNSYFIRRVEKRVRKLQKRLSKSRKGSRNYGKQKVRIRRKYMELRNTREDLLDRASAAMAKRYDTIIVEGLNVRGMMHNHCLPRGMGDASFYAFKLKLKWKAEKYGRNMIEIGRFTYHQSCAPSAAT